MAYVPKHKQEDVQAAAEQFLDSATGLPHIGPVIKDFLGNFFKGSSSADIKPENALIENNLDAEGQKRMAEEIGVKTHYPKPSPKDIEKGALKRFFIKDGRSGKIIEIDENDFDNQKKNKKLYKKVLRIEWYITGEAEDQIINGYKYPGTKSKNQDVINQAEAILPGIGEQILKDPGQFIVKKV